MISFFYNKTNIIKFFYLVFFTIISLILSLIVKKHEDNKYLIKINELKLNNLLDLINSNSLYANLIGFESYYKENKENQNDLEPYLIDLKKFKECKNIGFLNWLTYFIDKLFLKINFIKATNSFKYINKKEFLRIWETLEEKQKAKLLEITKEEHKDLILKIIKEPINKSKKENNRIKEITDSIKKAIIEMGSIFKSLIKPSKKKDIKYNQEIEEYNQEIEEYNQEKDIKYNQEIEEARITNKLNLEIDSLKALNDISIDLQKKIDKLYLQTRISKLINLLKDK